MLGDWAILGKGSTRKVEEPCTGTMKESASLEEFGEYHKAIESFARVLRSLGRHAFEMEQRSEQDIKNVFERLAMHVLMGTPLSGEKGEKPDAVMRRDWSALARCVNEHRQSEKTYVTRNLQDVRNVLWDSPTSWATR